MSLQMAISFSRLDDIDYDVVDAKHVLYLSVTGCYLTAAKDAILHGANVQDLYDGETLFQYGLSRENARILELLVEELGYVPTQEDLASWPAGFCPLLKRTVERSLSH